MFFACQLRLFRNEKFENNCMRKQLLWTILKSCKSDYIYDTFSKKYLGENCIFQYLGKRESLEKLKCLERPIFSVNNSLVATKQEQQRNINYQAKNLKMKKKNILYFIIFNIRKSFKSNYKANKLLVRYS